MIVKKLVLNSVNIRIGFQLLIPCHFNAFIIEIFRKI